MNASDEYEDQAWLAAIRQSQAIAEFSMDGIVIHANRHFLDAMGYAQEDVLSHHHSLFVTPAHAASVEYQTFWSNLLRGEFQRADFHRIGKNQREVWLSGSYNPVADRSGKLCKVVMLATDITHAMQQNRAMASHFAAVNRSSSLAEFALDGTILSANENFLNVLGFTLDEIQGKHHSILVDEEYRVSAAYATFWQELAQGKFMSAEFRRIGKTGNQVWFGATYNPVLDYNGKPFKVVKHAMDVTDAVQTRHRLAVIAKELGTVNSALEKTMAEQKLQNARFSMALDTMTNGLCLFDSDHRLVVCNARQLEILSIAEDAVQPGCSFEQFLRASPALSDTLIQERLALAAARAEAGLQQELLDGRHIRVFVRPSKEGGFLSNCEDVTERYRTYQSLHESEARYRMLTDHCTNLVVHVDNAMRRLYVSPSCTDLLGYTPAEFAGLAPADVVHPEDLGLLKLTYQRMQDKNNLEVIRYRYRHKNGDYVWVESIGRRIDEAGGFLFAIRDISQRVETERRLKNLALEDGLTGLANRRHFDQRLALEFGRCARSRMPLSLIMIDVDFFKRFNDTYGHLAGDDCLRDVARVMRNTLRRPADLAARYGGEELVALLPDIDIHGATRLAEKIRLAVRTLNHQHSASPAGIVTISSGVATAYPYPGPDADQSAMLVAAADLALYEAKANGRDRVMVDPRSS